MWDACVGEHRHLVKNLMCRYHREDGRVVLKLALNKWIVETLTEFKWRSGRGQ